jgi:hypothetical protein
MYIRCILFCLLVFSFSCESAKIKTEDKLEGDIQALKKFYFPLDELSEDGLVYEYAEDSVGLKMDYWLYKSVKDEAGDRFLIGTNYDATFEQKQFSREWIVSNGTILKDYLFFQFDSISKKSSVRAAKIEESVVFPFSPTQDSDKVYRFRLKYSVLPDTNVIYDLVRNRKFDKFTEYEFEGKKIPAVQFICQEFYDATNYKEGGTWTAKSTIKEIYAKGLGLVYKERKGEAPNYVSRLKRRISPDDFIKMQGLKTK